MRWVLELSPTPTRAFGNIPSAFVNGKNLSEILFFFGVRGSQPGARACSEVWRGARTCSASSADMSLLLVLPFLPLSAHLRATPEITQPKVLQGGLGWSAC